MTDTPIDIDRIVREVIAKMTPSANGGASAPAPTNKGGQAGCATPASNKSGQAGHGNRAAEAELVIASRVVTLDLVGSRLNGVRRLVVPPQAVLTPAVRDVVREKNISVVFATSAPSQATGATRLALVTAFSSTDPKPLVEAVRGEGIEVEATTSNCLITTTDTLADQLRGSATLGLVLTSQVAAALCLANRLSDVRAITADSAPAVARSATAVGANLLVVDPHGKSLFQLKQMVMEFCRLGPRACPEALAKRLA